MPKVKELAKKVKNEIFRLNIHAIIIPSADPHLSEYLPEHWMMREALSGFTGSAGTLLMTTKEDGLWTDSRYFLQGEEELSGSGIKLFKQGFEDTPSIIDYLKSTLSSGEKVGLHPKLFSVKAYEDLKKTLSGLDIEVVLIEGLLENIWEDRPALPKQAIFEHINAFHESDTGEKIAKIRAEMAEMNVQEHLVTSLDDIAWIFNLRGSDVVHNPVFLSFAVIGQDQSHLFTTVPLPDKIAADLASKGIVVKEYDKIHSFLAERTLPILVNPSDCNIALFQSIPEELVVRGKTISRWLKAKKSPVELAHIDKAMIKDGIALTHSFFALYESLARKEFMTEAQFAALIATHRSQQNHYYGESFPAIVGYEGNGAIVHYRPKAGDSATILDKGLLLCDSGGQYHDGTTDITRTIALGEVSEDQKTHYTLVLKGHIAVDTAVFPEGTTGGQLDVLARQFLWQHGLDYGHGTGHGVGYFLNVHEPPQGIAPGKASRAITAFEPGMLTSNEPGYYRSGAYGIRIENLIVVEKSENPGYFKHRHVTLFPIDTSLVVPQLLTKKEVRWLNAYHELVASKLIPHLSPEHAAWMQKACRAI